MNSQPTFGEKISPRMSRRRNRHQREHHQRVRREHGDAPVLVVAEAHFLVAEELMVVERVPLIDRAQALDVDRPVHDEAVHRPFEDVGEEEGERHREPLHQAHIVDVRDVDIEHGRAHGVDEHDVEIAVVPADECATGTRCGSRSAAARSWPAPLVSPRPDFFDWHKFITAGPSRNAVQRSSPCSAASTSAPLSRQSLSRLATIFFMNGSESRMALSLSPR